MPIRFDRYDVPRGGLPGAPGVRMPGPDMAAADALGQVSKAAQGVSTALLAANERKETLAEKVRVGERYLSAREEMDRQIIAIEQNPEMREKAAEHFGKWLETRTRAWSDGLTQEGALALQEKLGESRYTNGHRARMIEVKDLQARTDTVILGHAKKFVDTYVRTGSDLVEYEAGADGLSTRQKLPREFRDLEEAYGHAIASGAKTKDAAVKELRSHMQEASASKAHAMILAGNPIELRRLKDLIAQEEQKPGSTFLGALDADRRNAIKKQANDETYTTLKRQEERIDRVRTEQDRAIKEQREDWERRTDTMLRDGTLSEAWIEDGKKYGLASSEKAGFFRTQLEKRRTGEEGPNDMAVFQRLGLQVYSYTSDPKKVMADVEAAATANRLNWPTVEKWRAHLESRIKHDASADTVEKRALKDERQDVEKYINIATTTRSPFEKFDPAANRLKLSLMTQLGRLPQDESAKEWWFKNEAHIFGQMRGLAQGYIRTERAAMLKPDYQTVDDIAADKKSYVAKYGADWKARMTEDVQRLQTVTDLQAEIDSKQPGSTGTPGPKPSAPAAKPAEKKSGPLKSGSRS